MSENLEPQPGEESGRQTESSLSREPVAGTPEEQDPEKDTAPEAPQAPGDDDEDDLEAQAADDFFHDRPAATSARVFDARGNSGS